MILLWEPAYRLAVVLVRRTRLLRRFERGLQNLRPASLRLFTARTVAGLVVPGAIALALTFLLFELALDTVGVESIGFDRAASIYAVAYLVSALTMTPVGMGAYEGILTGFMALQGVSRRRGGDTLPRLQRSLDGRARPLLLDAPARAAAAPCDRKLPRRVRC